MRAAEYLEKLIVIREAKELKGEDTTAIDEKIMIVKKGLIEKRGGRK